MKFIYCPDLFSTVHPKRSGAKIFEQVLFVHILLPLYITLPRYFDEYIYDITLILFCFIGNLM